MVERLPWQPGFSSLRDFLEKSRDSLQLAHGLLRRLHEPARTPWDRALSGEFVVLVEDDDALRHALVLELEAAGYRVRAHETGEQALSVTAACPALAILDFRLPGMSGLDLLCELRVRYPHLRAIVISSDFTESQIPSGPEPPTFRVIRKPFAWSTFMAGVASFLG